MKKKTSVVIRDLNVNIDELKKKDPEILKKIRGGLTSSRPAEKSQWSTFTLACGSDFIQCDDTKRLWCPITGHFGCW